MASTLTLYPSPLTETMDAALRGGGRRRVIAETYLHRKREKETLQRQLDLAHVHADLNGEMLMRNNCRMKNKNGNLLQQSSWHNARG